MNTYQLDPKKFPRICRNIILTYALLAFVGLVVVYLNIRAALFGQAWTLIPFILLLFVATGWFALRQRRKYWDEFQLMLKDDGLMRRAPKSPELWIKRADIIGIKEIPQGLILSTKGRENALLIPKDLPEKDFQQLKRTMQRWVGKRD
jgi:cbb3-type cytochrome oxidase subunit 3